MNRQHLTLAIGICLLFVPCGLASDWPQFRHDAGRTAASADPLPADLHLLWTCQLPPPKPAFPNEVRLRFDASYEPVVVGKTMLVPSMVTDSITALDTETGHRRWRFFAEGPVRFAPVGWQDKVYFVSDDGYLYCLDAATGSLRWRVGGLPAEREERRLLGNGRLISLWPARGGPVLADGIVYFAAGLWPAYGAFVHAVDAETGKIVWTNADSNRIPNANMDHGIANFAGLTPQGYLAIVGGKLVVPCGAQLPAVLDLKTGRLDTYCMGWGGRVGLPKGSWFAAGIDNFLAHSGDLYDVSRQNTERFRDNRGRNDFKSKLYPARLLRLEIDPNNQRALGPFRQPVFAGDTMITSRDGNLVAYDLSRGKLEDRSKLATPRYRQEDKYPDRVKMVFFERWRLASNYTVHIAAGQHVYVGAAGSVQAIAAPQASGTPDVVWQARVQGTPHRMLAADGKLFVVTREGVIYAFGAQKKTVVLRHQPAKPAALAADAQAAKAARILQLTKATDGYAVVLGIREGRLVEQLVRQSQLHVIAIDPDADQAVELRRRLDRDGLYGSRATVLVGDPLTYPLPPYLANLVVSEDFDSLASSSDRALIESVFHPLRPYGGTACLPIPADRRPGWARILSESALAELTMEERGDWLLLARRGPLPGAADWTHRDADAGNTGAADDQFLKAPLELLWFDGGRRWPRAQPWVETRVCGGRVLVKERNLKAFDVYTGRRLWQTAWPFPPGVNDQLVAVEDGIYVAGGSSCLVLDPATGRQSGQIDLPDELSGNWSNLHICGKFLVAQCGRQLVCLDRTSGKTLWIQPCDQAKLSIAVGGDLAFCAELPGKRRGEAKAKTRAFELTSGQLRWERSGGAALRYAQAHDALVTPKGIYRGRDGELLVSTERFDKMHGDLQCGLLAIAGGNVLWGTPTSFVTYDLSSGRQVGERTMWVRRGCTGLRASAHLVTTRFRANASYVDIASRRITPIWNIRPGCNNNLFPADGVLNIPNITGGCECNYTPNSQAYVPRWTIDRDKTATASLRTPAVSSRH